MKTRRDFLKNSLYSSLLLPLAPYVKPDELQSMLEDPHLSEDEFWKTIRLQFPLKKDQVYFNNGTLGPMPGYVMNRVIDHMHHSMVHAAETDYKGAGPDILSGYFPYEELRTSIANLINADFKEIVLTQNATFGMNYIAHGLDLQKGDEIINTNQEHGGGFAAWQLLAKRKECIYKQAELPVPSNDPQQIVDVITAQFTENTKVLAIPHIVSVYGTVMPVKPIVEAAHKQGIFVVLDGAQTVGQIKVDVKDIGCDAYYSSLHKWLLAPGGSGILYINEDRIKDIWTTIASYNWENEEDHGFRLSQTGTGNPSIMAGLEAAIEFHNTIGPEKWIGRIKHLGDYLRSGLKEIDKVSILSSVHPEMCAGITTYSYEGISAPELQKRMWEAERLQPRSVGEEPLRHSVHIYNSESEIDRALDFLRNLS